MHCHFITFSLISEDQIFGVPLATLLENDRKRDPKAYIPLFLKEVRTILCGQSKFIRYSDIFADV